MVAPGYPPASSAPVFHFFRMKSALKILLAEDNADDVFLLRQALKRIDWAPSLHAVADGAEAIAYLEGSGGYGDRALHPLPDLLLLDVNMPRRNGFEVLEWIRTKSACRNLVVHVLSASARPADVQRAYDLHANSYVVKPTSIGELVDFVSALRVWHGFVVRAPAAEARKPDAVLSDARSPDSSHEPSQR